MFLCVLLSYYNKCIYFRKSLPTYLDRVNAVEFRGAVSEVEAMASRGHVCGVLVLAWVMLSFSVTATFTLSGSEKDAWPELIHANVNDAISILTNGGLVKNIYVQPPSSGAPPPNLGLPTDVWLYTDGTNVYEMPRRGVWHNNRLSPGWPEVAGTNYKAAISKIKQDVIGIDVIYGPRDSCE